MNLLALSVNEKCYMVLFVFHGGKLTEESLISNLKFNNYVMRILNLFDWLASVKNMTKKEVEVINVQRVTDIVTGKTVIQLGIGTPTPVTPEIEKRINTEDNIPTEVYTNFLQIMLPMEVSNLYTVGSKWTLEIGNDGRVIISKAVEKDVHGLH